MTSERLRRQIDHLLNEAEAAIAAEDWTTVASRARAVLRLDESNPDAAVYLAAAEKSSNAASGRPQQPVGTISTSTQDSEPTAFANGRYEVRRFLGEGGKKKVYLAHDTMLDRDIAFALIKTDGLDGVGRERIAREAQAMGRLGDHPNIVTVFDIGTDASQPFLVLPLLPGGDIEGLIEKAPEHKLPIEQIVKLGIETCQGLDFAHSKGIVHRDLKPGNVWLDEAGRAKIGDFGLAVAVDRSRLTQAGMMVGTVSYMPPEQATGGEITPRSDLYSLGAMLYEMVCGRPPFVGDESVAIIGQHLNAPPVAPTWHRPDCPVGLEVLILRLLEKDPSKRPGSAREVGEALNALSRTSGNAPSSIPNSPPSSHAPSPLYRGIFVGREQELRALRDAFDAATSGQGSLALVVGEPGIGKTALCEQLATYVAMRGGRTLVGHCYEEGSLSLPYLAFVEALRTYALARDPDGLKSDLGSGGPEVARIVSEVGDRAHVQPASAGNDPEGDRWRLMQAVIGFLRNAATVQPLLLVLEDLHWADRGTLDLLLHVARGMSDARILIVGTYRDVEVDRAHPLSATLADLRRLGALPRTQLRGLTVDEVHRMYQAIRGQEVPWAQAEAVHRQTEGNPLFIQEVLRYLVEEGYVLREPGRYVLAEGTEPGSGIPEGLRDVVGKRLNRLTERTNQVLSVAAIMGREFRLDILRKVASLPEEDLLTALEEATERAIVEQRQVLGAMSFRFTHAFFRQTLYEEIFAPRRIRLHQQVGNALEEAFAARLDDHAVELAEHFSQSTEASDLEKALHYCELAGQRARSVFAHGEAVRHLQQALRAQEVLAPDGLDKRCDLLLVLVDVLPLAGDPEAALEAANRALEVAETIGDRDRALKACLLALRVFMWGMSITDIARPEWVARARKYTVPDTVEEVRVDFSEAMVHRTAGNPRETWRLFKRSFELAEKLGDDEGIVIAAASVLAGSETPVGEYPTLIEIAERLGSRQFSASARDLCLYWSSLAGVLLSWARRDEAEAVLSQIESLAASSKDPQVAQYALSRRALQGTLDGNFDAAIAVAEEIMALGAEGGINAAGLRGRTVRRALIYTGRYDEALATLPPNPPLLQIGGVMAGQRAYCLGYAGRRDEAANILRDFLAYLKSPDAHLSTVAHRYLLEAAVASGDAAACQEIFDRSRPLAPYLITEASMCFCMARHLGDAAMILNRPSEAHELYDQAIELCSRARFRPELALSRLGMAELLLQHYPEERDKAIEHLDFAIAEFREMRMQPALERALGCRGLLKA